MFKSAPQRLSKSTVSLSVLYVSTLKTTGNTASLASLRMNTGCGKKKSTDWMNWKPIHRTTSRLKWTKCLI